MAGKKHNHGLDPKDPLEAPAYAAEIAIERACNRAVEQIQAKVMRHYERHPGSAWSGHYLVDLEKTLKACYKDLGLDVGKAFRSHLPAEMQLFYDKAKEEMKTAGLRNAILGEPNTRLVKQYLDSSYEQIAMRTTKMSFDHIRQLRSISADVLRTASLTGASRKEVTKQLLERARQIPGFEFIDNGGHKWKDETYFKMLARTELMNAGRAAYDEKCSEEGYDIVELDVSGNSCDECAKWEGKIFSLTGATEGIPTKQDLIDDGVFHPNCTHRYTVVTNYELKKRGYKVRQPAPDELGKPQDDEGNEEPKEEDNIVPDAMQCRTLQEAEQWAINNHAKTVNYDGLSLENANIINDELQKLSSTTRLLDEKYKEILTSWTINSIAAANHEKLMINPAFTSEAAFETAKNHYQFAIKSGRIRFTVDLLDSLNDYIRGNITHEAGHTILIRKALEERVDKNRFDLDGTPSYKLVNKTLKRAVRSEDIDKISRYAATTLHEFFAESFVMYRYQRDKLPDYIIETIEEVLK